MGVRALCVVFLQTNNETGERKSQYFSSVADLGEGPRGPGLPLFVKYLQKIYKKMTEMSIQKPF